MTIGVHVVMVIVTSFLITERQTQPETQKISRKNKKKPYVNKNRRQRKIQKKKKKT